MACEVDYRNENTRYDRMLNSAIAILEIHALGKSGTRTSTLREHIRQRLELPKLEGEKYLGDLRAHGDAIGGHGLRLNIIRQRIAKKDERIIMFTDENIQKCKDFVETASTTAENTIY